MDFSALQNALLEEVPRTVSILFLPKVSKTKEVHDDEEDTNRDPYHNAHYFNLDRDRLQL